MGKDTPLPSQERILKAKLVSFSNHPAFFLALSNAAGVYKIQVSTG